MGDTADELAEYSALFGLCQLLLGLLQVSCTLLHQFLEVIAVLSQFLLRTPTLTPYLRLTDLPLYCGYEPGQIILHYIIVCPGLHHLYRHILADRAGHDYERQVQASGLQELQCGRRAKLRHRVVRNDRIPRFLV